MFLTYVDYLNKLKDHPEWYNELTRNCTTTIQKPLAADAEQPAALELPIHTERHAG